MSSKSSSIAKDKSIKLQDQVRFERAQAREIVRRRKHVDERQCRLHAAR